MSFSPIFYIFHSSIDAKCRNVYCRLEGVENMKTRSFKLIRNIDLTGTSGTGHVASGQVNADGTASMRWNTTATLADGTRRKINTLTQYENWQDVVLLHGHAGRTILKWDDSNEIVSDLDILRKVA